MKNKEENIFRGKSFDFAVRVVNLCHHLMEKKREYILSRQLMRSGISIGANVEEAIGGQTRKDFGEKGKDLGNLRKTKNQKDYWNKKNKKC